MATSVVVGLALVSTLFAYGWGVACGYGWGRVMTKIERRELQMYREWLHVDDEPTTTRLGEG